MWWPAGGARTACCIEWCATTSRPFWPRRGPAAETGCRASSSANCGISCPAAYSRAALPACAAMDAGRRCWWRSRARGAASVRPGIGEGFGVVLKLSIAVGIALATPVWMYHLWSFIAPALTQRERRHALPVTLVGVVLFVAGLAVGFVTVVCLSLPGWVREFSERPMVQIAARVPDLLSASGLVEKGLGHLDVAGHSDMGVDLQRFTK